MLWVNGNVRSKAEECIFLNTGETALGNTFLIDDNRHHLTRVIRKFIF